MLIVSRELPNRIIDYRAHQSTISDLADIPSVAEGWFVDFETDVILQLEAVQGSASVILHVRAVTG